MDPMIDMSHSQLEPVEILGTDQQVQQHDRVRASGDGHQGSSRVQTEAGKVAAESLDDGHGFKIAQDWRHQQQCGDSYRRPTLASAMHHAPLTVAPLPQIAPAAPHSEIPILTCGS
jgi:hypothetical protein